MTSLINRRTLTIEWGQCDPAGIMFNSRYFEIFDQSSWLLFEAALGVKPQDLAKTYGILGIPLVDAAADFKKPARFGDMIEITSRVVEFHRTSFDIEHRITTGGELTVDGKETRVWVTRKDDKRKLTPVPVPADVIARFKA